MAEYSSAYTQNTTNITNGTETYKFSRSVSVVNSESMDNSCIYCGAEGGTVYDYYPTYEISSSPEKKAAIDSLWTFGGGNFTYTASLKETDYNICFALVDDTGILSEAGQNTVYQIGKQIYNKANPESTSTISVLNPIDIRKIIFAPSFQGYASGSPSAQVVDKDIKYLIDHPDDFWVTSIDMTSIVWNGTEYASSATELEKIRPCIVGQDYFLPMCNIFPTHHYDTTDYNTQKMFSQSYYGVYDSDGMPMSFSPIQANEALTYDPESSYGGSKTPNNDRYYYNYNDYTSKVQLIAPARQVLKLLAYCGCYFVDSNYDISDKTLNNMWNDEHIYLGEMRSGSRTTGILIKGTDILTSDTINKGEFSSQTDFDPSGGGGGSADDDPWHGVKYGSGGYGSSPFCTSYAMTGAELTQLAAWGGKSEAEGGPKPGYDYMPSIISLVELPVAVSGTLPSTVKFSRGTLGGYESNIVDTGVSGNPITAATQRYNLGSVTLPLRMSNRGYPFLDWDTVVELYLPFVGMFSLDPFAVLGRTITAFMDLDVLNGTICGYAYVTNNGEKLPVAYGSAQVGVSLPVTSDGAATARLALTTANAQLGSSFASSALQLGTMAASGGAAAVKGGNAWTAMQSARGAGLAAQTGRSIFAGGVSDAISGYATSSAIGSIANSFINWGLSLKQLQSSNNTQVNGSMGGGSFSGWSTPNQAYVKIIRPHAAAGAKASEYGNTHAYPFEDNAKLKDCKGLTFAVNPNVSGITKATDAERSQIAEILMGGVIA